MSDCVPFYFLSLSLYLRILRRFLLLNFSLLTFTSYVMRSVQFKLKVVLQIVYSLGNIFCRLAIFLIASNETHQLYDLNFDTSIH